MQLQGSNINSSCTKIHLKNFIYKIYPTIFIHGIYSSIALILCYKIRIHSCCKYEGGKTREKQYFVELLYARQVSFYCTNHVVLLNTNNHNASVFFGQVKLTFVNSSFNVSSSCKILPFKWWPYPWCSISTHFI